MALRTDDASILQHHLHAGVERQHHHFRAARHHEIARRVAGVVEFERRVGRKISGVDASRSVEEVGLKQGRGWHHKGDIVNGSRQHCPVRALASPVGVRARAQPDPDREEESPVDFQRDFCWELGISQAPDSVVEFCCEIGVVEFGKGGF